MVLRRRKSRPRSVESRSGLEIFSETFAEKFLRRLLDIDAGSVSAQSGILEVESFRLDKDTAEQSLL